MYSAKRLNNRKIKLLMPGFVRIVIYAVPKELNTIRH